ncbi:aminotransferase class I/II-fold pyridoxal phosphate-dependent enzyme [Marinilongibacter aquaticus]|uniref:aminotransferase class I/II-fold pyridoxal phosphate-dependent enzyme n=1 Tax=Marinilongibacter aquaticus TaxID=2975157 RepID=UPI0021BD9B3F|nr:aminotransferase class I/II-fold pyridoxal phosphate-dependent enzyme [Marinilongibacter aquaticus]UBM58811.1 aminotransferase class I/II-fold pyridoxal phosphate-dependent enzyme [Marinilongibacter aquaticus]
MSKNYTFLSLRDFEYIPGANINKRAVATGEYLDALESARMLNYRLPSLSGCGPVLCLADHGHIQKGEYVSFVSNDYLGFTQHPLIKQTALGAIESYGTGAGASPLIGGYYDFHRQIEEGLAQFFHRPQGSALIYTTGYTANSATLLSLLNKDDIAIVDMAVHTSVYEGIGTTNTKRFPHNDLQSLERVLQSTANRYTTRLVIVDGVYSQDGDIAPLREILSLCRSYGALIMVDDAHGIGVLGKTGRGALELFGLLGQADFITGTFSKTFAYVGGYVIADPKVIRYLQYQSRQYAFSASAPPSVLVVGKALELIGREPHWRQRLWENIEYFKNGLEILKLDMGTTQSAIIPVKIGDRQKTLDLGRILLENGIYTNPITYPAVSLKDARIRMSVIATHTRSHLDKALNVFEYAAKKLNITGLSTWSHEKRT